ncbi:GH92 family glycosyl hydrolase [Maribellus maritimus]|uniref:GH92 family glycosyl hydrolase n=1 Tax=Maribellus maritimus TaxID=2870838 RepID=UPI001EECE37C|nr:GH92 family glycosyl hydrolase [Maribellus maritimus]MCG6186941.1 GH92 family glycosyl hydrolase [Maribellus maritimus]
MRIKIYLSAFILGIGFGCSTKQNVNAPSDFTQFVNPMIGTAKTTTIAGLRHGGGSEHNAQVQPSVTVPFGMTNWSAQTNNVETKCMSAYYYKDSIITGFRGSHWLSGSCTQEYGSCAIMPVFGDLVCNPDKRGSAYSHDNETATPYCYKVSLADYHISAEMTATTRCGLLRFTFGNEGPAHLVINPNSDEGEGFVKVNADNNEIVGYNPVHRIYQGWGKHAGFSGYFVMQVEKVPVSYGVYSGDDIHQKQLIIENLPNLGAYFSFDVKKGEVLRVKIGTSFVSVEEARNNLNEEIPDFDFEKTKESLKKTWNDLLSRVAVQGDDHDDKVKFYTALYHCFQQPRIYNDVSGTYPRFDGNAQTDTICDGNYYCDFSVWDTYRAMHAFYSLIVPEANADMVRSLLTMAQVGGWMPIFPKWNSYTSAMIGDHVTSIVAEAYTKGVVDLTEEDYEILKHNANESPESFAEYTDGKGRRALKSYLKYGYIPLEDSVMEAFHKREQVSRTLEYAYDDFALAQIAKKMGKTEDYNYYMKRAQNYRNVFDPEVNNMNGRHADGTFTKDFTRDQHTSFITEGTPWQYNWYVPHDVDGLIELMGGKNAFNADLDKFFEVGQYWHGNEPGHQIPFLYNYSGQPWKTQKIVADVMNEEYGTGPGGLSGNDDAGEMSVWYVFGALGFYPVCPALPEYQICGSKFNKVTITMESGKTLGINAPEYSKENIYIQQITFNGKEYQSNSLNHFDLASGGEISFEMGPEPKK